MSGVCALSAARGGVVSAPGSIDPLARNAGRVEVVEHEVRNSVWAVRSSWYEEKVHPRLDDWWWRRLDCFAADWDDPRILALVDRMRELRHRDEPPFEIPPVVDAATGESGVVELVLNVERPWQEASVWAHSNDLLVDVIHLQRSRW